VAVACAGNNRNARIYVTAHFSIYYTVLDDSNIHEIADSLEHAYPKIVTHLQSGDLPKVNVHFYENFTALSKVFPDFPQWAVGQATSSSEIHMLSPNDSKQDYQTMIRNTKHEFAHCVSMKINSTIDNNPRWLWESIALYEANLPWDPHLLPYLVSQQPPSLQALNNFSNPQLYEVGYFIGQFVDHTYGAAALKALIQSNGDLKSILQLTEPEFTANWFAFVKKNYQL
jgi:hypothetical protein